MASGIFEFSEPGLTYSLRDSYATDLPVDPDNVNAVIEGEWLSLDAAQKLVRDETSAVQFPVLVDRGRTDTQSNGGKLTVGLGPKGAKCRTTGYGLENAAGVISYAPGDELAVASVLDANGNNKFVLAPVGVLPHAAPAAEGDIVTTTVGLTVVAKVLRGAYSLSGVGVGSRRLVLDIQLV